MPLLSTPLLRELERRAAACNVVMPVLEYPGAAARRVARACLEPMRAQLDAGQPQDHRLPRRCARLLHARRRVPRSIPTCGPSSTPILRKIGDSPRCYCVKTQPSDHLNQSTVGGQPQHPRLVRRKEEADSPATVLSASLCAPTHPLVARRNPSTSKSLRYPAWDPLTTTAGPCNAPCLTASDTGTSPLSRFCTVRSALHTDLTFPERYSLCRA